MSTALPQWVYPPRESGWEAEDLDLLPADAPRHIELLDGALIFNISPRRSWHDRVIRRLVAALEIAAPDGWTVEAQMTVKLNDTTRVYVATGVHRDRLSTTVPFRFEIGPADLAR